jgi:hypothetical protein
MKIRISKRRAILLNFYWFHKQGAWKISSIYKPQQDGADRQADYQRPQIISQRDLIHGDYSFKAKYPGCRDKSG